MRRLLLIGILVAGVGAVGAVSPLAGWQLAGTAPVPPGALAHGAAELPPGVLANGPALSAGAYGIPLPAAAAIPERCVPRNQPSGPAERRVARPQSGDPLPVSDN